MDENLWKQGYMYNDLSNEVGSRDYLHERVRAAFVTTGITGRTVRRGIVNNRK